MTKAKEAKYAPCPHCGVPLPAQLVREINDPKINAYCPRPMSPRKDQP